MALKYIKIPAHEAGAAIPGCGTIHKSEIHATLTHLSDELEFPFDLNNYVIGSTGKRNYSGDIDLVLDNKWYGHGPIEFKQNLIEIYGSENVARNGMMIHLRYPIVGYDPTLNESLPRTGLVQIDFNFGDYEWEKFYHYSHGDKSEYKGAHRNLAISAICATTNTINSRILDGYDRPMEQIRWKWGSAGFIRVKRESIREQFAGVWKRKQVDTIVAGPIFNPEQVARLLFPEDGTEADLYSLETIMVAVKRNFGMVDQERVWKRTASNFFDWKDGRNFIYPEEISKYFPTDDK